LSVEFSCWVEKDFTFSDLADATSGILRELLPSSIDRRVRVLDATAWRQRREDRRLNTEELHREVGAGEAVARLTMGTAADGTEVSCSERQIIAVSSRSCLSTLTAIATVLGGARCFDGFVDPLDEIWPDVPISARHPGTSSVDEIIGHLRPTTPSRSLIEATVDVLRKTAFPCDEWARLS
jgi:hypothetical protein